MKVQKTPIALATFALFAATPFAAQAVSVQWREPQLNETLSNVNYYRSNQCEVSGSSDTRRVVFSITDSSGRTTALNTETGAPWNCTLNSKNFADGNYTLRAVAYDASNRSASATRAVRIQNSTTSTPTTGGSTGGTTTNPGPTVTISKPANGSTISTGSVACAANATDADGIQSLQWYIGTTLLNTEANAPYDACNLNATNLGNGTHTLKAVATDRRGNKGEASITLTKGTTSGGSTGGGTTTNPGPVVTFTAPADGASLPVGSNSWSGGFKCVVTATDANGVAQVQWFLDNTLLGTEKMAPYDSCNLDTTKFTPGAHQLRAVATDTKGATTEAKITVNLGGTSTPTTPTNTPPTVSLSVPSTLSNTATCTATASDSGGSIAKVDFILVNSANAQTVVTNDTSAPYACSFDTKAYPNGTYKLRAVATDNGGLTATAEQTVTISNGTTSGGGDSVGGGGDSATGGTGTSLPSTNAKAVPTFESLGMYWKPTSAPSDGSCTVRYRKKSETSWKDGLAMWYDPRNAECRGSIVHLTPGTEYVVEMGLTGKAPAAGVNTTTWSENFPIAKTVTVPSGSGTLNITEGGSASGYVLYTGPATLDAKDGVDHNVVISAPYVIVRGLTLKGAKRDAISIRSGAENVVIEDNDISGWGRWSGQTSVDGWKVAMEGDSAISANCYSSPGWFKGSVIQRNKIHHPRYGASSWSGIQGVSNKHPRGSNAVFFNDCGGNHVIRFNETWSDWGKYFNDIIGGFANHSGFGMPSNDSDIYGNILRHAWDDAIESEGGNMNVRIWGNYIDETTTGIATTSSVKGPVYIFRNVWNRSRHYSLLTSLDSDERLYFFKSGSTTAGDGRRYVFHNTMLQAPPPAGSSLTLGGGQGLAGPGGGQNLTNTVSRNNIFHIYKNWWSSISDNGGGMTPNNLDYDLVNGNVTAYSGAEANRVVGTPTYKSGHGWSSDAGGNYSLEPGTKGHDAAARLPNFNDAFMGAAPDMGAHEEGTPPMKLGVSGSGATFTPSASTPTGTSTSSTGTTTTSSTDSGLCSSITCAAQ